MLTLTWAAAIGIAVALMLAGFALAALMATVGRADELDDVVAYAATMQVQRNEAVRRANKLAATLRRERLRDGRPVEGVRNDGA